MEVCFQIILLFLKYKKFYLFGVIWFALGIVEEILLRNAMERKIGTYSPTAQNNREERACFVP